MGKVKSMQMELDSMVYKLLQNRELSEEDIIKLLNRDYSEYDIQCAIIDIKRGYQYG